MLRNRALVIEGSGGYQTPGGRNDRNQKQNLLGVSKDLANEMVQGNLKTPNKNDTGFRYFADLAIKARCHFKCQTFFIEGFNNTRSGRLEQINIYNEGLSVQAGWANWWVEANKR